MRTKPVNGNKPKRNLSKPKNAKMEWMKPQKTTRDGGRTTREGEHHVPVRTWARKRDKMQDKMQERMHEREKGNVSERELWSNSVHKTENEGGRQSVKVKSSEAGSIKLILGF